MVKSLGEVVVAQMRRAGGNEIITHDEIAAILGHEQEKQLLGCNDTSCFAELGGALGADELLAGSVAKLGTSWLLHLKRIDVEAVRVVAQADRRLKGGTVDDLLDALPAMTQELLTAAGLAGDGSAGAQGIAALVGEAELPPAVRDQSLAKPEESLGLVWHADGQGRYFAHDPTKLNRAPLFFGNGKRMYKQRVESNGRTGPATYGITVWEPRHADGYKRHFRVKEGVVKRRCGDETTELTLVPEKEAKKLGAAAQFFEPRWRRAAAFIAMAPDGRYFVLDKARAPRGNTDYRLFIGNRGAMRYVVVKDVARTREKTSYLTAGGVLEVTRSGREEKATWRLGNQSTELNLLSLYQSARMIYTELGVYKEKQLGTFCDPP